MIPEKSRQERIDAIFEQELHAKPLDVTLKPALASGGYTTGTMYMVVSDEYRPFTLSDTFDKLNVSVTSATGEMFKLQDALGKWGYDGT